MGCIFYKYMHIFKIHVYKHKNKGIPFFTDCWVLWETESEKELRLQNISRRNITYKKEQDVGLGWGAD